ncbi:MAG TPA: mechanosensitive ion channel domain-containing protein [Aromatoleum sp.]|uniref:mechanosensitive ion channel family protein n=1 Tax=Aromatoleum sp. TaxID=2307007 RepID=UPI002B4A893B|nr:mechanosensitive ion channel domain-containing protein [Aromatoleum sp.]HJV25225.1 mechanosensitive ion channel domain-containing protein [Aromatoleum sp.]
MTEDIRVAAMLTDIWSDLQSPVVLWQIGAIILSLGTAWLVERAAMRRVGEATDDESRMRRLSRSGLRRVLFPLTALAVVFAARAVLHKYHNVHLLNLAVPLLTSFAAIRLVVFAVRRAIGWATWLASFERVFASLAWAVFALHILGWLPDVLDALDSVSFNTGSQKLSVLVLLQGVAMVLVSLLIALWAAGALERRLSAAAGLDDSVRLVLLRVAKALLLVVAVLVALPMVGINLTTLSVFGGALGVGLGFGLQKIAANYVSGFIILLDRSLRIGNLITVGNERGVVTQINTRYTVLRAGNGVESLVPNETLVGSVVQNETYTDTRISVPINFQVGYSTDLERALVILVEAAKAQPRVLPDPTPKAFVVSFGDNGIDLRLSVWVSDPQEGTLGVISEINLTVWRSFRREGIEIPFPQREVRLVPPEVAAALPAETVAAAAAGGG